MENIVKNFSFLDSTKIDFDLLINDLEIWN